MKFLRRCDIIILYDKKTFTLLISARNVPLKTALRTYAPRKLGQNQEKNMNSSKNYYSIHKTFTTFMVISLLAGLAFFATNNLDFVIASITYNKFSVANTAYCLAKTVGTILLPLIFILPLVRVERIKAAKFTFILYGVLQLLSLSWIVEFLMANDFNSLFSNDAIVAFQSAEARPFVSSLVYWDTYTWMGSILTLLYSILCIYTGISFDDDKKKVCILVLITALSRPILTIISNLILGNGFLSIFWVTNNYADVIALVSFSLGMFTAYIYDETWITLVWNQEIPQNEDE